MTNQIQSAVLAAKRSLAIPAAVLISACLFFLPTQSHASTYKLPANGGDVVGGVHYTTLKGGQTFSDIAQRNHIGYYELLEANPQVNPMQPIAGTKILVPTRFVLPKAPRKGIVINLAELRLYYYPPNSNTVQTYPIGIGRQGWETPTGTLKIIQRKKDPAWRVPASVWADAAENGIVLPKVVPPGPDNPLGQYALRLSRPNYLIHGTNKPNGVGRRVSAGCIRMYPEDIKRMYSQVSINTPVTIVNQPFKTGWLNGKLYLEAHRPLFEQRAQGSDAMSNKMVHAVDTAASKHGVDVSWAKAKRVAVQQSGIPVAIN